MPKPILVLSLLLIIPQLLKGQSLNLTNADTLMVSTDASVVKEARVTVENTSNLAVRILVSRQIVSLAPNHTNYFCWGPNCNDPSVSQSTDTLELEPEDVNTSFKGYLDAGGWDGVSVVRYCFTNLINPADQSCFTTRYVMGTAATSPPSAGGRLSGVVATYDSYSQTIHVDVKGGTIETLNMLGQKVDLNFRYDGSGMSADASALKTGYYFLFGRNERGPWSSRVIVTR
jgi:hypothetical protein